MSPNVAAKPSLRGIIHCHSRYSHDSFVPIRTYLRIARKQKLDFIILTDHDTAAGSSALRAAASRQLPNLEVPLAAEYLTSEGDVIAAFLDAEVNTHFFPQFVAEARRRNGLLLLPHPCVGHRSAEMVAKECDLVEVLNCRARPAQNLRAGELAQSLGKRAYAGSDAHFVRDLREAILTVDNLGSLRESLLHGRIRWEEPRLTSRWEYGASQMIKSWKKRDPSLALRMLRRAANVILRRCTFQS